jgi:DNA-directed RNA polymerase subunit K/omega
MPAQVLAEVGPRVVVLDHASPPSIAIYEVDRGLIANVWLIEEAPPAQH